MSTQRIHFKVGSRKAFAEEARVVDAANQAAVDVAERYGNVHGGALFKVISRGAATPTVYPQAVDIVRHAVAESRSVTANAQVGRVQATGSGIVSQAVTQPRRRSGIAEANRQVADSLRRLGFHL